MNFVRTIDLGMVPTQTFCIVKTPPGLKANMLDTKGSLCHEPRRFDQRCLCSMLLPSHGMLCEKLTSSLREIKLPLPRLSRFAVTPFC